MVPIARVFMADGKTPVTGVTFRAQLYAGPDPSQLQPAGAPQPFFTPNGINVPFSWMGVVTPKAVKLNNVAAYRRVYAQVRVWDAYFGDTYEAAAAVGAPVGESAVLKLISGSEVTGPAPLRGLTSFKLH